ncbi:uncharacterized protein [Nicotiana sylvestris]|uniref:uncharacterized protein n=1 Tax=Nicotiana sylvestris TaxID=4096 RepID=UPI00388CC04D
MAEGQVRPLDTSGTLGTTSCPKETLGKRFLGFHHRIAQGRRYHNYLGCGRSVFQCLGSKLSDNSSFHPQSDGQTKRFNGMLEEYLRHFVTKSQKNWVKLLDAAQLCFNSQKSSSTNKSAFEIVTGQQPLLPHTINTPNMSKYPPAASFSKEWKQNLEIVQSYFVKAQKRMKRHADRNRHFVEYQVGDKAMVKIPKWYLFAGVHDPRLLQKYIGPLSIERRIGKVAYCVDTPAWWKIHLVFHVILLKPFLEDTEDPSLSHLTIPSIRGPNSTGKRRVKAILDDRVIHASRKDHQEFVVKWHGCDAEENTWERGTNLKAYKSLIEDYFASTAPRTSPTQLGENVMGGFPTMPHDPLGVPRGVLVSLSMPSAADGPVVLAVPSDKRACASVTLPISLASAQPQANASSATHTDNAMHTDPDAKDYVADNGPISAL